MSGIRVTGLPAKVTDKHLKVYFSNPKNGGGRVQRIYHPLPNASAVVIFDDKRVVEEILRRKHQISGKPVDISATPAMVFRRVVVELDRSVSDFLGTNPQLVDELQFDGEINVNFQEKKQVYLFDGTWYQLEWAMHYLDTMLEAFQFDMDAESDNRRSVISKQPRGMATGSPTEFREDSPPRFQEIQTPNIPAVRRQPQNEQQALLPPVTGYQMSDFQKLAGKQSGDMGEKLPKGYKNKNALPLSSEPRSMESKMYGRTVLSNLNDEKQNEDKTESWRQRGTRPSNRAALNISDDVERNPGLIRGAHASYKRRSFEGHGDSGDENEASAEGFSWRSLQPLQRMTKGIDVAMTDFGEGPLSFTFEVPGSLKVHITMDDITKQTTDAIINPTTPELSNVYGTSRAISAAVGFNMQAECRHYVEDKGPLDYAGVMHTAAGGSLSEKVGFVIHTAGPTWSEDDSEHCTHLLVCTYINCLQYADQKLWVQSLATPLISAGFFGFPLDVCIGAFYDALLLFSTRSSPKRHLKEIHLVCFDQDAAAATIMIVQSLLDCDSAQSAVAATDRYWVCSSKYNFQAEDFGKASTVEGSSGDENSDEELKTDANSVVRQEKNIQARIVDQESDSEVSDADGNIEEKTFTPEKEPAQKKETSTDDVEKSDVADDMDKENLNPFNDAETTQEEFGQTAVKDLVSSSRSLEDVQNDEKIKSDADESDDGGFKMTENISEVLDKEKEAESTESESLLSEKLDGGSADQVNDFSDEEENASVQDESSSKVPEEKISDDEEKKQTNDKVTELEADPKNLELEDEEKKHTTERKVEESDLKVSVGKTSLGLDDEWSMVPGNDVTKQDASPPDDNDSEDERGEKIYL